MEVITNLSVYDLEESLVASGYAMLNDYNIKDVEDEYVETCNDLYNYQDGCDDLKNNKHYKRALRLAKAQLNSGHPNFLTGILVSMDVTFTNKVYVEWQRYHFQQIITSQSTMHKLSKFNLDEAFIEYTDPMIVERLKELQKQYNDNPTKENYLKLVYSCPSGLKLTARVTTNYLQLMTMYKQRRNHRLIEWQDFCKQLLDELPLFYELLEVNDSLDPKDKREEDVL